MPMDIGQAVGCAASNSATGHPATEGMRVMAATSNRTLSQQRPEYPIPDFVSPSPQPTEVSNPMSAMFVQRNIDIHSTRSDRSTVSTNSVGIQDNNWPW